MSKPPSSKPAAHVLTINGGSSSIKFALFEAESLRRTLAGRIEGIGFSRSVFSAHGSANFSRKIHAPNHTAAVKILMDWLQRQFARDFPIAVGHRIVHGGAAYWQPERITPKMLKALRKLSPFDPEHLPQEILLVEAFRRQFPRLPQIACFDTAFHHSLPRVAQLLPIPRRYFAKGVRRYGFHGLSCAFLMEELARLAGTRAANGRVILAHLGNGASITAVRHGKSVDTSMAFTPAAGIPMSTRSGDLDPGIAAYLTRTEGMTAAQFQRMVNHESGLLGISETSPDMRELGIRAKRDPRAADAVAVFCYQAKKFIGAYAAALGGLDTLVFAGGIGENSSSTRAEICRGLDFLGLKLDQRANRAGSSLISSAHSAVAVHVIRTDEEQVIAKSICRTLGIKFKKKASYENKN
jgi:acetate kinase